MIIEFIFWYMCKDDAVSIMNNSDLNEKRGCYNFFHYRKMSETAYYQKNKEVILNRAKDYDENNKEVLRQRA